VKNADLKPKYDEMHKEGPKAWTTTGWNERMMILGMIDSWEGLNVLEIGCGEGDLAAMMTMAGAESVYGVDYSQQAIDKAILNYPQRSWRLFECVDYRTIPFTPDPHKRYDLLVMQGVLEHLDKPYEELKWMVDNLIHEKGAIITTSPGFLNMRGMWWMYEKYVHGVKVSLTDLHEIHPWDMLQFAQQNGLLLYTSETDFDWGWGKLLVKDFTKRIPAACKDHDYTWSDLGFKKFLTWMEKAVEFTAKHEDKFTGATIGYRLCK
jgi:SAM-dependent methyltransferase